MPAELHISSLLTRLSSADIDFVVVGGIAVIAHGHVRNTTDLDICYRTTAANLELLAAALLALGARLRGIDEDVPFAPDARALRQMQILTLETHDGALDLLVDPAGSPGYEVLKANAERVDYDGHEILIASIADLIAMKRAAGRVQDLADIEALEAIARMRRRG